jgi:cell division protein FtsB
VLAAIGIAGLAAIVLVRNLLPARRDLAHTLQQEATLREQLDALHAEKALLEDREKALREDPTYIERVHRAQTGMTRPGEFIVR